MANTSSAKKAQRVAQRRRIFNVRRKKTLHDATKAAARAVASGSAAEIAKLLPAFQQALDKAAKHGTIEKNTAARLKSRMAKRVAALKK